MPSAETKREVEGALATEIKGYVGAEWDQQSGLITIKIAQPDVAQARQRIPGVLQGLHNYFRVEPVAP